LAVKIVRQPKKIALIGAPSSAAAFLAGSEKAPAALRKAGIVEKLQLIGYEVVDHGDCAPRLFADDDEHKRARNLPEIVAGLNDLKTHAEIAIKSGALVMVLGGDCAQIIGLLTGARRYYRHINLLWMDRDADLHTPATTPSGRIDGMPVAHIIGKGAPELVRFWGEPPLVREPDVLLFGLVRVDPPEQDFLIRSPMRHMYAVDIQRKGAKASAKDALAHLHAESREFMVHLDMDVVVPDEFPAVNVPDVSGGLTVAEAQAAFAEALKQKTLLAFDVAQYNPDKDPDGSGAAKLVNFLVDALKARLDFLSEVPSEPAPNEASATAPAAEEPAASAGPAEPGAPEKPVEETPAAPEPEPEPELPAPSEDKPELPDTNPEPKPEAGSEPESQ